MSNLEIHVPLVNGDIYPCTKRERLAGYLLETPWRRFTFATNRHYHTNKDGSREESKSNDF